MTKAQALEIFKFMLKSGKGTIDYWSGTIAEQRAAIEIAIKALKQQPSDDCISRKAVIDLINADWKYEGLELSVNELPPVTPTRKVGKWEYTGSYEVEGLLKCTICGHEIDVSEGYYKFCPMCGAKMEGEI